MHFDWAQKVLIWAVPVLFAITFHEIAHGWVAARLGDKTAERLGRLSPNPLRHIDPIGTVLVPAVLYVLGGFIFGWAKPVPVDWRNLKHPRRDMAIVAMAGPIANFIMAALWLLVAKLSVTMLGAAHPWAAYILLNMGVAGVLVNMMLGVFNLIPIPPLDGSRVLSSLLPRELAWHYERLQRFSLIIILVLLASGVLSKILSPLMSGVLHFVMQVLS